jgi:hypothetical protein
MSASDPSKRIPKSLGTEASLFGTYTLTDLAVALSPGVAVVLLTQVVLPSSLRIGGYAPQTLTLPVAAGGIALGGLFVYVTPAYASSLEWLTMFLAYQRSETELPEESVVEQPGVRRVHRDDGVIERTDGALFGLVQVSPPTMALATEAEWARKAEAFQDFCNTTLEFPIQIFSTTQPFPVDEYLSRYETRLEDPDVRRNPQLARLIEEYIEWYEADLEERRMTIRDHYVVVPVAPHEVHFERDSLLQQFATVPLVGLFVRAWLAPSPDAQHGAMVDAVHDRTSRVTGGINAIEGCVAESVDVERATSVIGAFWGATDDEGAQTEPEETTEQP